MFTFLIFTHLHFAILLMEFILFESGATAMLYIYIYIYIYNIYQQAGWDFIEKTEMISFSVFGMEVK